ncbi:MAG: NfeD family protein [Alphaproteobacteria bacterium]
MHWTPRTDIRLWLFLSAICVAVTAFPASAQENRTAIVLDVKGAIGPASAEYVLRGIESAPQRDAGLVILRMDTPGGLDTSMREIIRAVLASPVPVATYIAPSGARAASAGTYIAYASHIAAMARGTNLGAATPVAIGIGETPKKDEPKDSEQKKESGDGKAGKQTPAHPTMEDKATNDAVAYIRSLAELRGRNADWAERAVREAASLSATEAAKLQVIDFIASSVDELLEQADGRTVTVAGKETVLQTRELAVLEIQPDWRTRILAVITDPNVALIFLMIGLYGLIFEFMNPGALFPGILGAICFIVGIYSLALLPVTFAGVALILLGGGLMIAEGFIASHGVLGVGGAVAFVLGAIVLMEPGTMGFELRWSVVIAIVGLTLAFSLIVLRMAYTSFRRTVATGREEMIGMQGTVQDWSGSRGSVLVHGEIWSATSAQPLAAGALVRVTALNGLVLTVVPWEQD